MKISIICIGNEWQLDDGVGPVVGRFLVEHFELPENVNVLDRAVMGYGIVPDLQACDVAIVVDALDGTGTEPGTVLSFGPADAAGAPSMVSLHDVRFADVLASAQFMGATCQGYGFGVQIADRGDGALDRGLSKAVAMAVEPCARAVVTYLRDEFGVAVRERDKG